MAKIKIIRTPPGPAPEYIRTQWVGIGIPLMDNAILKEKIVARIGDENTNGYEVKGIDAVKALEEAGRQDAADFWRPYSSGNFIFKKEVCEIL